MMPMSHVRRSAMLAAGTLFFLRAAMSSAQPMPVGTPPGPAPTQGPSESDAAASLSRAKDLFQQGVARLEAGDVEGALELFMASRAARPSYSNSVNAALCLERLDRSDEALDLFEEVLARFGAELDPPDREALPPKIEALRGKVGTLSLEGPAGTQIFVDESARGTLPLTDPLRLKAGEHRVRFEKEGLVPHELPVFVLPRTGVVVTWAAVPIPVIVPVPEEKPQPPVPPPQPKQTPIARTAGWVTLVVGAAAIAGGGIAGGLALGKKQDLESRCPDPKDCDDTGLSLAADGQMLSSVSTGLFIGGGVAVAGGGALILWTSEAGTSQVSLAPRGVTYNLAF